MQLAPLRFATIDGTKVSVHVTSAAEAREALKELKHKKKELQFTKRGLLREKTRLEKAGRKPKPSKFVVGRLWQKLKSARGAVARVANPPTRTVPGVEREIHAVDETIFNIDSCILQLQGKLLKH